MQGALIMRVGFFSGGTLLWPEGFKRVQRTCIGFQPLHPHKPIGQRLNPKVKRKPLNPKTQHHPKPGFPTQFPAARALGASGALNRWGNLGGGGGG